MKSLGDIAREAAGGAGLLLFLAFIGFAIDGHLARWDSVALLSALVACYALFFVITFVFGLFFYRRR